MRMQTGRFVLPNWKTGVITMVVLVIQCIMAFLTKTVWVLAMPFAVGIGFVVFSDVLSIEERAEKEDQSFLSRYTIYGGGTTVCIAALQLINSSGLFPDDNPETVFYNSMIFAALSVVITVMAKRFTIPSKFSNLTGWVMLSCVGIQALVAYIRQNDIIFIPNEMMFITFASWLMGLVLFFLTSGRTSGYIGSLAPHFALVVGGGAIFEVLTREMPDIHKYTWAVTLGAAVVMAVYGAIDYVVFRPRRERVSVEYRKLE